MLRLLVSVLIGGLEFGVGLPFTLYKKRGFKSQTNHPNHKETTTETTNLKGHPVLPHTFLVIAPIAQ